MTRNVIRVPQTGTGRVNCGSNAAWSGFASCTFETWVYFRDINNRREVASVYETTGDERSWLFGVRDGGAITFTATSNGSTAGSSSWLSVVSANVWTHVAIVFASGDATLFIDGVGQGPPDSVTGPFTGGAFSLYQSTAPLWIGNPSYTTGRDLNGDVFEFRIWDVARTQTEINENKDSELLGSETGLVAYYKMDEGTGGAVDSSPTAQNGVLESGATWETETTPWSSGTTSAPDSAPAISTPITTGSTSAFIEFSFDETGNTGDPATGYEYRLNSGTAVDVGDPEPKEYTVSGLTSETTYTIEMRAYNSGGVGPWGTSESFTTDTASSDLTMTGNFDSGNLDAVSSSIAAADSTAPVITLVPRLTNTAGSSIWKKFHIRLNNALDRRPEFRVDVSSRSGGSFLLPIWYSYDGSTWTRFDHTPTDEGGGVYSTQLSTAFTQDELWVAAFPPYPIQRDADFISEIQTSHPTLIHRIPSVGADPDWAGGWVSSQTDEQSRVIPTQPVRGFGLWDGTEYPDSGLPKATVVLTSGIHAGEDLGSWGFEGFIRLLLSGTPQAQRLLKNFQFFCYPNINPMGRWGGHHRGQWDPASLTKDTNRDWSDQTLESTQTVIGMLGQDINERTAVYWIDFHSWATSGGGRGTEPVFYIYRPTAQAAFVSEFETQIQSLGSYGGFDSGTAPPPDRTTEYALANYGNRHAYVFEAKEYESSATVDAWAMTPGEHFAQALDAIQQGVNSDQVAFAGKYLSLDFTGSGVGTAGLADFFASAAVNCDCDKHERGLGFDALGRWRADMNGAVGTSAFVLITDAEYSLQQEVRTHGSYHTLSDTNG